MTCLACGYPTPAEADACRRCGARLAAICPRCNTSLPLEAAFCFRCGIQVSATANAASAAVPLAPSSRTSSLAELLAHTPDRRLPLEQTLRIADQVCQALADADACGMIHADLRPETVCFSHNGGVTLGDSVPVTVVDVTNLSATLSVGGTAGYLAPERSIGGQPDVRSDLYSLGVLLYELVTGQLPFASGDPVAVLSQHLHSTPVAPSWHNPYVPTALETLILRLLAKDPTQRPPNTASVRQELAAITALAGSPYRADRRRERDLANPLDRLAAGVFVGREHELAHLRDAFDAALAGRGGITLVAGEPGIGKTTLAEETVTYAQLRGAQVLWGRCYEWDGAPAYWPWIQIIRAYIQRGDPERLRAEMGAGAAHVAQVVPEVHDQLPGLPEPPRLEGEQARFHLFDSIATFLRKATTSQPLLLVLDDLHWADTPSLLLLQFVARELEQARVLVVGTYRDVDVGRRHPLTAALAELARGHGVRRLRLQGLVAADIERFITLLTGIAPEAALVDAVLRETEGNPFFVSEIMRLLVAEGRLGRWPGSAPWSVGIPESVRDVIGRRLDRLSSGCNDVLAIASVIGREFTLAMLQQVSGLAADVVLDTLDEALGARLIDAETGLQRYRFTHALVQDTLYAEVSAGRRLRLHAAVGQALEQLHAIDLAPYFDELAHHYEVAAPVGYAERAVTYAVKAGERALTQFAWETGIQHFERALHALDMQAEPHLTQRCDILLALGSAQFYTVLDVSESPGGQSVLLQAAEIAQLIGSYERLARAALGYAGVNVVRTPGGLQQVQLLEAALELAPPGDSALTARLLARLATDYRTVPTMHDRIMVLSDEATAMARRLGDPVVLAFVLLARRTVLWDPDDLDERLALTAEARQAAGATNDLYGLIWSDMLGSRDLYEVGDNKALDRAWDAQSDAAQQLRIPYYLWGAELARVARALKEGRFAETEAGAQAVGGDSQAMVALYFRTLMLFHVRREQGRLHEVAAALRAVIALTAGQINPWDRHRGHIAHALHMIALAESGRLDAAREQFELFVAEDVGNLPRDSYWLATIALLADVCALLDDRTHAGRLHDLLLPYAQRNAVAGSGIALFGSVSYYLGLLATLLARWENAEQHFQRAQAMNERMRARPAVARTDYAWARMLVARGEARDRHNAHALLSRALAIAQELGMPRLMAQAQALAATIETTTQSARPSDTSPHALTARELDVLRLIVAGHSNSEIAAALFISPRTVSTHVGNIFNKLGFKTRAEAAAFAVRYALA